MIKYSIVTPVYLYDQERAKLFKKCIQSVRKQHFDNILYEHIIVNDGSILPFNISKHNNIRVINQPNLQRITAYNTGLKEAKGEIIVLLDSDDELEPNALQIIDEAFKKNPTQRIFNFGCSFIHKDGATNQRGPFRPKKKKVGHVVFGGGNIVNGTFVFKREVYDKLGGFPEHHIKDIDCTELNYPAHSEQEKPFIRDLWMTSPYDFSAYAQLEFREIQKFFMVKHPDHPKLLVRELGNPFGNDYYLFYKYTRKYHSKPIDEYILKVHLK